jgi:hypothetical protein
MDDERVRAFLSVYVGGVYTVYVYEVHVLLANAGLSDAARARCVVPTLFTDAPTCSICLDEHGARGSAALACGHCFHAACIDAWLRVAATCPNCRLAVDAAA